MLLQVGVPRHHRHEIGHERGYLALEDGRIAAYDVRFVDVRVVQLGDHWVRECSAISLVNVQNE